MNEQKTNRLGRPRWLRIGVLLVGVALVILVIRQIGLGAQQQANAANGLQASGIIQADEVDMASQFGGRIADISVAEGDSIISGSVLVKLDTTLLDTQVEAAQATVAWAKAGMAQAQAGARPGQIAVAEAQLSQAQSARDAARQTVSDTLALVENPQDINMQIAVTAAQLEANQHQLAQAEAIKDAAEIANDRYWKGMDALAEAQDKLKDIPEPYRPKLPNPPLAAHLIPNTYWQAWVGVNAAGAQQDGTQATLAQLYAQRADPQTIESKADQARSALAQSEAQVAAAQAQLDGLKAGATQEQLTALEAHVAQAQAALDSLLTQRAMMTITAPISGVVMSVVAHPGEVAAPGATLLTVANLSEVKLVVYLPETQIGQVHLGQHVQMTVDSFPGRVFEGRITHIADQAEFTPRNVATQGERVTLVFAIEIRIANNDGALKPGMPADAVFGK